jgi:hypothetical protein
MRHYLEPIAWLVVCLLFIAALVIVIAPLGMGNRPAMLPSTFDTTGMKTIGR